MLLLKTLAFASGLSWTTPNYTITSTVTDHTISSRQAIVEFTFEFPNGTTNKDVQIHKNGRIIVPKLNAKSAYKLTLVSEKTKFEFLHADYCKIVTDTIVLKEKTRTAITVKFQPEPRGSSAFTFKPVIYLYPEISMNISLKLDYAGELGFTYPEYSNGWNVLSNPDGTIETSGKKYNYLFWDGIMNSTQFKIDLSKGFIVSKADLVNFLETKLASIGLNTKETADFITFWVPLMNKNETNYIHFLLNDEYNQVATLDVSPKPVSQLRLFMIWSGIESVPVLPILPQTFNPFQREGFTLIEWGGSELPELINAE